MATQDYASGDDLVAIFRKILNNQMGTYSYASGDNLVTIAKKILQNQFLGDGVGGEGGGSGESEVSFEAVANSTGNSTLTPAADIEWHRVRATITGSASTRIFILATANRTAGDRVEITFVLPDTASIVLEVRNATAGGTLIYTYTTNATEATNGYKLRAIMEYDGSAWQPVQSFYPAI